MSIGDCPNWPKCGHSAMGQCDADMLGIRQMPADKAEQAAQPVAVPGALPTDWLREADLLYRLDEHGNNHDEIKVAMAGGRRDLDNRAETARLLLALLETTPPLPQVAEVGKLVPLDEPQLRLIWATASQGWLARGGNPYLEYARAIEAAHGIGPEQEGR